MGCATSKPPVLEPVRPDEIFGLQNGGFYNYEKQFYCMKCRKDVKDFIERQRIIKCAICQTEIEELKGLSFQMK